MRQQAEVFTLCRYALGCWCPPGSASWQDAGLHVPVLGRTTHLSPARTSVSFSLALYAHRASCSALTASSFRRAPRRPLMTLAPEAILQGLLGGRIASPRVCPLARPPHPSPLLQLGCKTPTPEAEGCKEKGGGVPCGPAGTSTGEEVCFGLLRFAG